VNQERPIIVAAGRPVGELIDQLVGTHHPRLRRQLQRVEEIVREMTMHGEVGDPPLVDIQQLAQGLSACVDAQLNSEEQILFPMLRRLEHQTQVSRCRAGMIASRVRITEREFARIRGVLLRLRELANEYASPHGPCESCHELSRVAETLLFDLRQHADEELGVLYPWAIARERELAT
jgi:iron-sulfur cluster repair protein YtfE (RIC family)